MGDTARPQPARLRTLIAEKVQNPDEIRLLWEDAGLPLEELELAGIPDVVWMRVLERATRHGPERFRRLIQAVVRHVPILGTAPEVMAVLGSPLPTAAPPSPSPTFASSQQHDRANKLAQLVEGRGAIARLGRSTTAIDLEILDHKRLMRRGPGLPPGYRLGGGRYLLIEQIGHGGFATVWQAYDTTRGQDVAIKVLHGHHGRDTRGMERFDRGALRMGSLTHPHIVLLLEEPADDDGFHYFVMELLRGGDLEAQVKSGPVPRDKAVRWALQIADALAFSHQAEAIHRDVKPKNILLTELGQAKLTDFDLVRAFDTSGGTQTGAMGTLIYSAPEVLEDASSATAAADQYSLAMTLLFLLRGKRPTHKEATRELDGLIASLGCPEALKGVLTTALQWEPEQRHPDMAELSRALAKAHAEDRSTGSDFLGGAQPRSEVGTARSRAAPVVSAEPPPRAVEAWWLEPGFAKQPARERIRRLLELGRNGDPRLGMEKRERWVEIPSQTDTSEAFLVGRYPVSNVEYAKFMEAGGYQEKAWWCDEGWSWLTMNERAFEAYFKDLRKEHTRVKEAWKENFRPGQMPRYWKDSRWNASNVPVVGVSWYEAEAYCRWLTTWLSTTRLPWWRDAWEVRLPTDRQWEAVAIGHEVREFPWGDDPPGEDVANFKRHVGRTTPVGAYPGGASPQGVLDLGGNVWEWSIGLYDRKDPLLRVLRGGAWNNAPVNLRGSFRYGDRAGDRDGDVGFRCVLCVPPSTAP